MSADDDYLFTIRRDYSGLPLMEDNAPSNPFVLFDQWMKNAIDASIQDPNAFDLATADLNGRPSSRIVLLREATAAGFVFFTNYNSAKGKNIQINPHVSMNFFWKELARQIRIEGSVTKVSAAYSDEYFESRPRENQIGALASDQSEVIQSRKEFEQKVETIEKLYTGKKIPRPSCWGGFRVKPVTFEFWQGRENRLHDRLHYAKMNSTWKTTRLSP